MRVVWYTLVSYIQNHQYGPLSVETNTHGSPEKAFTDLPNIVLAHMAKGIIV